MENRIKSLGRKQKKTTTGESIVDGNANILTNNESTDEDMKHLIIKMKSVVIDESSLDNIKGDLRTTRDYRSKMLLNTKTDLLESYPYFFTNIDLVCVR